MSEACNKLTMERETGFTLVELLITIVVVSILLAAGVPAFKDFIKNNRVTAQANDLVSAIQLARSEALKRGVNTVVCASQDQKTCTEDKNTWADGWIVYSDFDPGDGTDPETLTKNADIAMYRAKNDGRNNYCFFTEAMQERSARNLWLTNALRHALEREQLHLVFQPQVSLSSGRIIGAETLLRWTHPELGSISPAEFIPLAEESGLILPIGEWVLRSAVKQAKEWIEHGLSPMTVAVNISAVQFRHPRLPELVSTILDETGLPPQYLELELTEAVAMNDPKNAYAMMDDLHARGVRMSIDDFGTGYSSLGYLKKFKVYKLKIDQSFVRDIYTDPEDRAIVNAIISMAHSLGLQTIAEGVETPEQLIYLNAQGCDEVQGYYYSKPLPAEAFEIFVKGYTSA